MKKLSLFLVFVLLLGVMCACNKGNKDNDGDGDGDGDGGGGEVVLYDLKIDLPTTELLPDATDIQVVVGAPELMIVEVVLDTYYYFHYETMSGYEYIKVFNNTDHDYNLKGHRVVLSNPYQGQNWENEDCRKGNKVLATGYLFMGLIDEDFIIPSLSYALIWLKPYYWTVGSGTDAYNKPFSAAVIHKDNSDQKGAISQTIDDFKEFWKIDKSKNNVYELTNMGIVGIRPEGGTDGMFPIYSPGAGTPYTHLNSSLLRSIEIQKFNDQNGTASISLLNKYQDLPAEKQQNPDPVYGKKCFNVMEIRQNETVVDGYYYENVWQYFDPIVRINFCGRIDVSSMTPGQTYVDFKATGNPGVAGWPNTMGLQFRPPLEGERLMQWQLPVRELNKFKQYLDPDQYAMLRFSEEELTNYRFTQKTIKLIKNPADGLDLINWRTDEVESEGRLTSAAPNSIKTINLIKPGI
jgi:hypothetical protein